MKQLEYINNENRRATSVQSSDSGGEADYNTK
jgi:hypothetical protein